MSWFKDWFNTSYYHLLYNKRNETEAKIFIDNIFEKLKIQPNTKILDLACGKGRHSVYMNKKGMYVTGVDISIESINYAKKFENETLKFIVQDMREDIASFGKFDTIFNLFTSFGYFQTDDEHQQVIKNLARNLQQGSLFVIDFMNVKKVINNLVAQENQKRGEVFFDIQRVFESGMIKKNIVVKDKDKKYNFEERVRALYLDDFQRYFEVAGLQIKAMYGDYNLNDFDINHSERLILISEKK